MTADPGGLDGSLSDSPLARGWLARRSRVGWHLTWIARLLDELIAGLDAVFHEETVAHGVVGHVVLHLQVVGAVHRHAAIEGIVDGSSS